MLRNLYFTAVVSICITANSLTGQTFTKLLDFGVDIGYSPHAPLIQGLDGALYGTTPYGGAYNYGTVFKTTKGASPRCTASMAPTANRSTKGLSSQRMASCME